jgi:O-antigen ligase
LPEHLRALVFILAISGVVFALAKAPITAQACALEDFKRRRNLWFVLTLSAFLAHNFWLFIAVASAALIYAGRAEPNRFALYLGLMLALPRLSASIPGFGLMKELFSIEPLRLLSLLVLLPAYLSLRKQPGVEPFGRLLCDKLLICSFLLEVALTLPFRTFTSVIRDSVFYEFTNVFLLYYVASRSLRSTKDFRDALGAFTVGVMVFCAIVACEFARRWLLYAALDNALGVSLGDRGYLLRSNMLRAEGTAEQSIVAGYTCAVGIGLYLYVRTLIPNLLLRRLGMLVLIAGIIGAFARAPWLGATGMIMLFILLGPAPVANLGKLLGVLLLALPVLLSTQSGAVIIDHLPWVGTVDSRNVDGREHLAEVAIKVVMQNPFFGNFDFAASPSIEDLRGSDGIVDLVNTYVMIALKGGLVSLALFFALILVAMLGIVGSLLKLDKRDERHVLGRSLFATIAGVLFIIGTVSPIFFVYPLYWCLAGMAVGYMRLVERGEPVTRASAVSSSAMQPRTPSPARSGSRAEAR